MVRTIYNAYPKYEGKFLSGISLIELQARTPNTKHTNLRNLIKYGKIKTTCDHHTERMAEEELVKYVLGLKPFLVDDEDKVYPITNFMGNLVKSYIEHASGNLRFLREDKIVSTGEDGEKSFTTAAELFGDHRIRVMPDYYLRNLLTAVKEADIGIFGARIYNSGTSNINASILLKYIEEDILELGFVPDTKNSNKFHQAMCSTATEITKALEGLDSF